MNKQNKITINDVAKKAGVSITSVSFAFNNPSKLPEGTVQRILEIAEDLGYVPDPIARSMSTGRTGVMIGILVPQPITEIIRNPFISEFIEGVSEICIREGFSIMLVPPLEGSVKRAVARTAVDGFITLGLELFKGTISILRQRNVPFVMVDADPVEGISSVNITDEIGAYEIMEYVLSKGHRFISILGIRSGKFGKIEEYAGTLKSRVNGYQKALKKCDLSINNNQVYYTECSSTMHGGEEGFHQMITKNPKITCFVAMSDIIAFGAMNAAKKQGIKIPDNISVVGFDDVPYSKIVSPPLTTISQPLRDKGKTATDFLVNQLNGELKSIQKIFKTKLIIRESVKQI